MPKKFLAILVIFIVFLVNIPAFAQSINISLPVSQTGRVYYSPYSNNISFNSRYISANKNLGRGFMPNYSYYSPYNFYRYNNIGYMHAPASFYQINRFLNYSGHYTPYSNIPVGKIGNTRLNLHMRNIKSPKLMIYSY
jgi:hypothetical protein